MPEDRITSYKQQVDWSTTLGRLSAADKSSELTADELVLLVRASMLVGDLTQSIHALARAHQVQIEAGDTLKAVRTNGSTRRYLGGRVCPFTSAVRSTDSRASFSSD